MSDELDQQKAHRYFAADAFNACWQLIEKEARTPDDDDEMLRLAEASFWHWHSFEGHTGENLSIGYWQLARVYVLANQPARALRYAEKCLEVSERASLSPFCMGYAYEALARAQKANGDDWEATLEKAYAAAESVTDEESKRSIAR